LIPLSQTPLNITNKINEIPHGLQNMSKSHAEEIELCPVSDTKIDIENEENDVPHGLSNISQKYSLGIAQEIENRICNNEESIQLIPDKEIENEICFEEESIQLIPDSDTKSSILQKQPKMSKRHDFKIAINMKKETEFLRCGPLNVSQGCCLAIPFILLFFNVLVILWAHLNQ